MAVITWRVIRLERKPSAARTVVRSRVTRRAEEQAPAASTPTWPPVKRDDKNARWSDVDIVRTAAPALNVVGPGETGAPPETSVQAEVEASEAPAPGESGNSSGSGAGRFVLAVGSGALILTAVIGWAIVYSGSAAATLSPAAARVATPLELVALESARDGDRVTIHGMVRNPAAGSRVQHLEAVVFLFDRRGMYVGTTHAFIAQDVLAPGTESLFEIPLASGRQVSLYRVSFRMSTAPVPHIDRRPAAGKTITPGVIIATSGCNNHSGSDCFS